MSFVVAKIVSWITGTPMPPSPPPMKASLARLGAHLRSKGKRP